MRDTTIGKKYILKYHELQTGDIILESGKEAVSDLIKIGTQSKFSHVMICIEPLSIMHADSDGIFSLNPQRLLVQNIDDFKVLRLNRLLSESERDSLTKFLREKVGSLYSVPEAARVPKLKYTKQRTTSEKQFCSRLVAQAYAYAGIDLVDNIDFCTPEDINRATEQLIEVKNLVKKATKEDLDFSKTFNSVYANQLSTYKWLRMARIFAKKKYKYTIINQIDIQNFLYKFPQADKPICKYIKQSGYLEDYKFEINNNPFLHDEKLFMIRYHDDLKSSIFQIANIINSPTNRAIDKYLISRDNYLKTKLNYYRLERNLQKTLLSVSLSKYLTIFSIANNLMNNGISELNEFANQIKSNIAVIKQYGIERYDFNN